MRLFVVARESIWVESYISSEAQRTRVGAQRVPDTRGLIRPFSRPKVSRLRFSLGRGTRVG